MSKLTDAPLARVSTLHLITLSNEERDLIRIFLKEKKDKMDFAWIRIIQKFNIDYPLNWEDYIIIYLYINIYNVDR